MRILNYKECNITGWHREYYRSKFFLIRKVLKLINSNYDDIIITTTDDSSSIDDILVWEYRCEFENLTKYFLTEWGAVLYNEKANLDDADFSIIRVPLFLLLKSQQWC